MTTEQIAEKRKLYRMIWALPPDKVASAVDYVRYLEDDDEPPLTPDELAQIAASEADIAAGRVYTLEEFNKRMEALP